MIAAKLFFEASTLLSSKQKTRGLQSLKKLDKLQPGQPQPAILSEPVILCITL